MDQRLPLKYILAAQMEGDPFSLLLKQRTVFLTTDVNDAIADSIVSQLILLDAQDNERDIKLFINSPGGSVTAGMAIYDAISMCKAPISTICFGLAASMGAFLLMSGTKGKRYAMPNSRIMIHQPLGGAQGVAVEVEIQAKEILFHKANINRIMSFHTGQPEEKIEIDTDSGFFYVSRGGCRVWIDRRGPWLKWRGEVIHWRLSNSLINPYLPSDSLSARP